MPRALLPPVHRIWRKSGGRAPKTFPDVATRFAKSARGRDVRDLLPGPERLDYLRNESAKEPVSCKPFARYRQFLGSGLRAALVFRLHWGIVPRRSKQPSTRCHVQQE